ncbi:MAG TPA: asparagine synthase-related protein [Thermoanaerobaculia bacterium]|nr:asparagine synthase-related protein [Thermoanaerobaculia bacterium]
MAESTSYRAPGGIGYLFLGGAGLAYQALQAPAAGRELEQPLLEPQHQVCIVMDGRLDNRSELIDRLGPAEGKAISDAGLLLAAYLEWGETCTDHLLGDFAFAIWDAPRRRLLCAVDPLGVKPLHYAWVGSLVCFASDAVQVLQHPAVPDGYDELELAAYLASQIEHPEQSFFAAIRRLAPGQRLVASETALRVERYWVPDLREICYTRDEDYADHFRDLFQRAVTDRLRGEGNSVGVAMSGGLDSSSVAAVAHRAGKTRVRAFTFVFERLAVCDERPYSRAMTEELALEVEPVNAERVWRLESLAPLPHSPDTPFVGWFTVYREILQRMSAKGARVLLTGHGGDDLLRGSSRVYADRLRRRDLGAIQEVMHHARGRREPVLRALYRHFGRPFLPPGVDRLLLSTLGRRQKATSPEWLQRFVDRVPLDRRLEDTHRQRVFASFAQQEVYENLVRLPWYWKLANWHDRNAAPHGIEVRHPFLDRRLFEYALSIPGEQLFRLGATKSLLRRSMAGTLPERIRLRQGKTQFKPFLDHILRELAFDEIEELLRSPRCAELGFLDGESLRSTYRNFLGGGADETRRALWYSISLEIWLRRLAAITSCRHQRLRGAA